MLYLLDWSKNIFFSGFCVLRACRAHARVFRGNKKSKRLSVGDSLVPVFYLLPTYDNYLECVGKTEYPGLINERRSAEVVTGLQTGKK